NLFLVVPEQDLAGAAQLAELGEDAAESFLDLTVGTQFQNAVLGADVTDGHLPEDESFFDLLFPGGLGALAEQAQLEFSQTPLQAQQKSVIEQTRVVDALLVDEQGPGQGTQIDQVLPVPLVTGQARSFQGADGADLSLADGGEQAAEAWALLSAAPRAAEILIEDDDRGEAELAGAFGEGVPTLLSFAVITHLGIGRLADVDVGLSVKMRRVDLVAHGCSSLLARFAGPSAVVGRAGRGRGPDNRARAAAHAPAGSGQRVGVDGSGGWGEASSSPGAGDA